MTKAVYAGSFDPMTKGHLDIVEQALGVFDEIEVAIGVNPDKQRLFDVEQTADLINGSLIARHSKGFDRVTVSFFEGALVDHAERVEATAIIRGLRQVSDFNDEFTQHGVNSRLTELPIIYFICHEPYLHVSSSTAKLLVKLGKPVDWLVDSHVADALEDALYSVD